MTTIVLDVIVITTGNRNGIVKLVQGVNPIAIFVHCAGHRTALSTEGASKVSIDNRS